MKRWLPFIAIACTAIWVVVYNEHHKTDVDANPRSILYTVADTGREIEHVDQYHCAERVQLEANARKWHLEDVSELAEIPITLFQVGYSKQQEMAADQEGTRLAVQAGYSPMGAIRLFQKFQRMED